MPWLLLMCFLVNRRVINYMFSLCLCYFSLPSMLSKFIHVMWSIKTSICFMNGRLVYHLVSVHLPLHRQSYFQVLAVREMLTWTLEPKYLSPFNCIGCTLRSRTTGTWSFCLAFCLFACLFFDTRCQTLLTRLV